MLPAALCLLAGCTKNEVKSIADNLQTVSFNPLNGRHSTRTMVDGTTYPTNLPFGTLAYFLENGKTWNANIADASLFIPISKVVNATGVASGDAWEVDGKTYYWPKNGSLTFFSYSPFTYAEGGDLAVEALSGNDGIQIKNYDVDIHQGTDFMVADAVKDQKANVAAGQTGNSSSYNGVPVVFRHKLSQICGINFLTVQRDPGTGNLVEHDYANGHTDGTYEAGDVVFKLKNVTVKNLRTQGNYAYTGTATGPLADGWDNQTNSKDYTWYNNATPVKFTDNKKFDLLYNTQDPARNGYLLILPQGLHAPGGTDTAGYPLIHIEYQILTYTGATAFSTEDIAQDVSFYALHESASAVEMNKKITYNFKISLDKIYWAPSVVDWEDKTWESAL